MPSKHPEFPEVGHEAHGWTLTAVDRRHADEYADFAFARWEHADGRVWEGFLGEKRPSAVILPITEEGNVVLVREFRHGARETVINLPGGLVEDDKDPTTTAKAEFGEETGYQLTGDIKMAGVFPENPAQSHKRIYAFTARVKRNPNAEPEPGLEVIELPFEELVEVLAGRRDLGSPIEPVTFSVLAGYVINELTAPGLNEENPALTA